MGKVKLFLLCVRTGNAHSPYFMWCKIEYPFYQYNKNDENQNNENNENNKNQILGYESMVILLFNVVQNYVNFCFFSQR